MTTRYFLTNNELKIVKQACQHMGLNWHPEAARPRTARLLVSYVVELGVAEGCEAWARHLADEEAYRRRKDESHVFNRSTCNSWYKED